MNKQAVYIGQELKKIRSTFKISQSEMADQIGIKRSRLGSYEEGRAMPDICTFLKICGIYKVNIPVFYQGLTEALKEQ